MTGSAPRWILWGLCLAPALRAGSWTGFQASTVELFTDGGAGTASRLLARLERVRTVIRPAPSRSPGRPLPIRIFVFSREEDFRRYRPSPQVKAFFQSGPQRDYILADGTAPDLERALIHEYIHSVLQHVSGVLPQWLEEGTSEFFSTLESRGSKVRVGAAITSHLRLLGSEPMLSPRQFLSIDKRSPEYSLEGRRTILYYAQSWAFVHMLNLAPRYRPKMPVFGGLLADGRAVDDAFQEAFGIPIASAVKELPAYLRGPLPILELASDAVSDPAPVRLNLDPRQMRLVMWDVTLHAGTLADAERIAADLVRSAPDSMEAETVLAFVALRNKDTEGARRHFERATSLGSKDAEAWFEYALLLRDSGGHPAAVNAALIRATELMPDLAEAQFILGIRLAQEKRFQEAIQRLERATEVLPRQSYFWHALAMAYRGAGKNDLAHRAAYRALDSAGDEHDREMAEAAVRLTEEPAPKPAPIEGSTVQPPSRTRRLQGTLRHIDCLGRAARVQIEAGGTRSLFYIPDPGEVLLRNAGGVTFEFRCGPQSAVPVTIEYEEKSNPRLGTRGEITLLEFNR